LIGVTADTPMLQHITYICKSPIFTPSTRRLSFSNICPFS
jgi:hypothetical protein